MIVNPPRLIFPPEDGVGSPLVEMPIPVVISSFSRCRGSVRSGRGGGATSRSSKSIREMARMASGANRRIQCCVVEIKHKITVLGF